MTDHPERPDRRDRSLTSASDGELLSAYLLADLDAAQAAHLEQRLAVEPELALQLDALADALVRLGGHDDVALPDGLEDRLEARLAAAHAQDAEASVPSLDAARRRRAQSPRWWAGIGTAAAVVAIGGVMAAGALRGAGQDSEVGLAAGGATAEMDVEVDAEMEAGAPPPAQAEIREESGGTEAAEGDPGVGPGDAAQPGGGGAASAPASAPQPASEPVLLDRNRVIEGERALRSRYRRASEVNSLLGLPVAQAQTLAPSFTAAVQRAGAFGGGVSPAACLDVVGTAADQPLIPARVETLSYQSRDALAYALVTATPQAKILDRVEIWVVAPEDCSTLVFSQL